MIGTILAYVSFGSIFVVGIGLMIMHAADPNRAEYNDFREWQRELDNNPPDTLKFTRGH